ncbi:hypothetical protein FACS189487_04520 [Campylobacterota bacterium]|nr:hypothetical protein FACS189487_04520 [Campylobacterota bacterium]
MSKKNSFLYAVVIVIFLAASFLYARSAVDELRDITKKIGTLSSICARLDSVLLIAGQFIQTDFAAQKNMEALISSFDEDDAQIAKELKQIYSDMLSKVELGMISGADQGFSGELSSLSSRARQALKDAQDDHNAKLSDILLFVSTCLLLLSVVWFLRLYFEKIAAERTLSRLAADVERFARFITLDANEFERIAAGGGTGGGALGVLAAKINAAADGFEASRDDNLLIFGELLLIASQLEKGRANRISSEPANYISQSAATAFHKIIGALNSSASRAAAVLGDYQKGDYSGRINAENATGDAKRLYDNVNALGSALSQNGDQSLKYSVALNGASKELAQSVDHLSKITEDQAQSVKKITFSVREIVQKIQETTHKAEQMAAFAIETKEAAAGGILLTQDTVKAMEDIGASTTQIKEAIAVIDTISFQTNILSLNAAVEAATAGEAGKGFAVVAGEVRTLAGKSAEAAKKIKELVVQTQAKAGEGLTISKNMIGSFDLLSKKISDTYDLVSAVTAASQEEMKKAGLIGKIVEDLDAINRKNSESAARTDGFTKQILQLAQKLVSSARSKNLAG